MWSWLRFGTAQANTDLTIALVDGSRRDANRIGAVDGVDFVLQGGLDQDEPIPPHQAGKAWVLHASRQGQGLTVVDVYQEKKDEPFVDRSEWSRTESSLVSSTGKSATCRRRSPHGRSRATWTPPTSKHNATAWPS